MRVKHLVIAAAMASLSTVSFAGDVAAGKAKSAVCAACHGANGKAAIPTYPNLAGQNAGYLEEAMKAYKAGQRTSPQAATMKAMAMPLTDADIKNLAAYYASLK